MEMFYLLFLSNILREILLWAISNYPWNNSMGFKDLVSPTPFPYHGCQSSKPDVDSSI